MIVIDCNRIKEEVLKGIEPHHFENKSLLIFMKENNSANRSYVRAIESAARRQGLPTVIRHPDPERPVYDIRRDLRSYPKGTAVLFVGYKPEEIQSISVICNKELNGKRIADNDKYPDVVKAVMLVIQELDLIRRPPRRTVIIGRSYNAEKLCSALLLKNHTPTLIHTKTIDREAILKDADLIISFAGHPNLIKADMVRGYSTIISVGCGTQNGKLCGDIDLQDMEKSSAWVTPTPGGIGPICTAVMIRSIARWEVGE